MAVHTDVDKTSFTLVPTSGAPIELKYGEDYVTKDQTGAPSVDLDAPIVFVGYGIDAPEYQWNDYQGIDVKEKSCWPLLTSRPRTTSISFRARHSPITAVGRTNSKKRHAEVRRG